MVQAKIILASASPRRRELLGSLLGNFGLSFKVVPSDVEEIIPVVSKTPGKLVCGLSKYKADYVARKHKGIIIAADTIVVIKDKILGKPESNSDAWKMLSILSGNYHYVYTGVTIAQKELEKYYTFFEKTKVYFRNISRKEIDFYIKSCSSLDKAGSYGIQDDFGSTFVTKIKGDFFNVVGLPIVKTYLGLKKFIELGI